VVTIFTDFAIHVLSQRDRGDPVPNDKVWKHEVGCMKWFYHVSHPIMIAAVAVADYTNLAPPYE
jgi:sarcosine oxidase delta subunit